MTRAVAAYRCDPPISDRLKSQASTHVAACFLLQVLRDGSPQAFEDKTFHTAIPPARIPEELDKRFAWISA